MNGSGSNGFDLNRPDSNGSGSNGSGASDFDLTGAAPGDLAVEWTSTMTSDRLLLHIQRYCQPRAKLLLADPRAPLAIDLLRGPSGYPEGLDPVRRLQFLGRLKAAPATFFVIAPSGDRRETRAPNGQTISLPVGRAYGYGACSQRETLLEVSKLVPAAAERAYGAFVAACPELAEPACRFA